MLANAPVTFWRWLTGQSLANAPAPSSHKKDEERRVWVRRAMQMNVRCGEANDQTEEDVFGVISDLSRGGVQIVSPRRFDVGTLLNVRLSAPAQESTFSALACVVRAQPHGDSEWAMGCRFSCELDEEQLVSLGAARVRPSAPDARAWQRFSCSAKAFVQRVSSGDLAHRPARVLDIAVSGLALHVEEAIPVGELVNADLVDASGKQIVTLLACVVNSQTVSDGYRLGCNFIRELNDAEIRALMA
jgi:hypothetical protein